MTQPSKKPFHSSTWNRRDFLSLSMGSLAAGSLGLSAQAGQHSAEVSFFLISDTHYFANKEQPDLMDERSSKVTSALIETLNRLPDTEIPIEAGGGKVLAPQGVIHGGDVIDSGDKNGAVFEKMQATEWKAYCDDYGITGSDGKLKYPIYEVHGNHDGPQGKGIAIDGISKRNQTRAQNGMGKVSPSGLQFSWNWGDFHFVNLGIVVGQQTKEIQRRRYAPMGSLDFLIEDLSEEVGNSGRPVILTHHIDVARYSTECSEANEANLNREWHPCDVRSFHEAIKPYNVIALLYGHTHVRNLFRWNGTPERTEQGIPVFNVDNSSHFSGPQQAFMYFELGSKQLTVRECATKDGWQSYFWTPQAWTFEY